MSHADQLKLALAGNRSDLRNVCVIAHVDHGKTSICDHLVSSNGYLSRRVAGSARYMDSREDEQTRLITIKSSSIPLLYKQDDRQYVINLIDSPGHADFSAEVSAAARLSDGALLVIDVLEGFASQTKAVLRQAYAEGLKLLLVFNKIDRLYTEINLSAPEIYSHLAELIESVNAGLHKCIQDTSMEGDDVDEIYNQQAFSPERGNVLFASASDGWAFSVKFFAKLLADKLTIKSGRQVDMAKLLPAFWGDYYLDLSAGGFKITTKKIGSCNNIATQLIWQSLRDIYSISSVEDALSHAKKLGIYTAQLEASMKRSRESLTRQLMSVWLPCADKCFEAICDVLPDPLSTLSYRMQRFAGGNLGIETWGETGPVVLYIAKSLSSDINLLRLTADKLKGNEELSDFVGFGRVFSGSIRCGQALVVAGSDEKVTIERLFCPQELDLIPIESAGAGAVVAVAFTLQRGENQEGLLSEASLEQTIRWLLNLKGNSTPLPTPESQARRGFNPVDRSVTFCDRQDIKPLDSVYKFQSNGVYRLGVSPLHIAQWPQFLRGLALLHRADPAVFVDISESGEFILCCQGQIHSERVLNDLKFLYAPEVELSVSPPLMSLRESLAAPVKTNSLSAEKINSIPFPPWRMPAPNSSSEFKWSEVNVGTTSGGGYHLSIRAIPMPEECLEWMDANSHALEDVFLNLKPQAQFHPTSYIESQCAAVRIFSERMGSTLKGIVPVSLCVEKDSRTALARRQNGEKRTFLDEEEDLLSDPIEFGKVLGAAVTGFRQASCSGPICEEPIRGVIFVVEQLMRRDHFSAGEYFLPSSESGRPASSSGASQSTSGSLISCVKSACRGAMEARGCVRLCELMLRLEVTCEESVLGKVYDLLAQKRGVVQQQEMDEKNLEFHLVVLIPANESFELAMDLKRKSSGRAWVFFHVEGWRLNPEDPFPEALPTLEAEENEGEVAPVSNVSRRLVNLIRARKGLPLGVKVVSDSADKQRTLSRTK